AGGGWPGAADRSGRCGGRGAVRSQAVRRGGSRAMSVDVLTFGCRLNAYESEGIRREAEAGALADTVVVNTCAVTAGAVRQGRQTTREKWRARAAARTREARWAGRAEPARFAAMPEVDRVLGNEEKMRAAAWADTQRAFAGDFGIAAEEKIVVNDIMAVRETAPHLIDGFEGRARAVVQVQNGCDHRCTFCIIPYGRGNSRSVPMGEVVD